MDRMQAGADILKRLSAPFSPTAIHWRIGAMNQAKDSAIALAYLDARDVMLRLDETVGSLDWQARYPFAGCCEVGIRFEGEWIWKANCAGKTQIEAEKGEASDSFKRAAVLWGIGRYLYDLPNVWVPVENKKFSKKTQAELTERLASWQDKYFRES